MLIDSVQVYLDNLKRVTKFTNNRPGRRWFEKFRGRHGEIVFRTAQHLTAHRANVTEEELREWFAEVRAYLDTKNLLDIDPSRIFNCVETNILLCPKPQRVLAKIGSRRVYKIVDANEKES